MKKIRRVKENAKDDPLGIGLSKKTLVLIGIGLVGVIGLKIYLDKKKAAQPGASPPPVPPPPSPTSGTLSGALNGMNGRTPAPPAVSTHVPQSPASMQMPNDSPRTPSRANYESAGGFSGLGDGNLGGANSRM